MRELRPVMDGLDPFLANFNPCCAGWTTRRRWSPTSSRTRPRRPQTSCPSSRAERSAPSFAPDDDLHCRVASRSTRSAWRPTAATATCSPSRSATPTPPPRAEIFPSHDCGNTFGGQRSPTHPPSNPPQEESGQFPFSSMSIRPTRIRSAPISRAHARAARRPPPTRPARSPRTSRRSSAAAWSPYGPSGSCLIGFGLPSGGERWPTSRTPRRSTTRSASCSRSWPPTRSWAEVPQGEHDRPVRHRDPDATITVRLKEDEPAEVDFGETEMEPEVVMSMEADTAHRFWLGEVNVTWRLPAGRSRPAARSRRSSSWCRSPSLSFRATRRCSRPWVATTWSSRLSANADAQQWAETVSGLASERGLRYEPIGGINPVGAPGGALPGRHQSDHGRAQRRLLRLLLRRRRA